MNLMAAKKLKNMLKLIWLMARFRIMDRLESPISFVVMGVGNILYILSSLIYFNAIYGKVTELGAWRFSDVLILIGVFNVIDGLSMIFWQRSLWRVPEMVLNGELDSYIIKPINTQFYLTFYNMDLIFMWPQILFGIYLIGQGAMQSGDILNWPIFTLMFICSCLLHYAISVIITSINFFNYLPNTLFLTNEIFILGEYPIDIYKGLFRFIFTFIVPIGLMFSMPPQALLGKLSTYQILTTVIISIIFFIGSNIFFAKGLKNYQSAKG
mgnify:CR=1 FL=1